MGSTSEGEVMLGKIKIIYVIPKMEVAGTEKHLYNLVKNLDRRIFSPHIICTWRLGRLGEKLRKEGFPITSLGYSKGYDPRIFFTLLRLFLKEKPSILQTYLFGFHLLAGLAGRIAGIPLIISTRRELAEWRRWYHWLVEMWGNFFVDLIITCSEAVKSYTLLKEKMEGGKIRVIYNGVEWEKFTLSRRKKFKNVGMIANFYPEKGHLLFLKMAKKLLLKYPFLKFFVAGEGSLREKMERKAIEWSLKEKVKFLGLCPDIPELLRKLDIIVIPSLREGLPNVLLESLAAGKPVVASCVGGIPEVIKHRENGLLVKPGNVEELVQGVSFLLENPEEALKMGRKGRKDIQKFFSLTRMVEDYQNLYLSYLEKNVKNSPFSI